MLVIELSALPAHYSMLSADQSDRHASLILGTNSSDKKWWRLSLFALGLTNYNHMILIEIYNL